MKFSRVLARLRACAVILVLLAHSNLYKLIFPGKEIFLGTGKSGVWLFFVLSSFLLYSGLKKKILSTYCSKITILKTCLGMLSIFLDFTVKRVARLFPLLWLYSLLVYAFFLLSGSSNKVFPIRSLPDLLSQIFLIDNPIGITWSLIVEFKFYLILMPLSAILCIITNSTTRLIVLLGLSFFIFLWTFPPVVGDSISLRDFFYIFVTGMAMSDLLDSGFSFSHAKLQLIARCLCQPFSIIIISIIAAVCILPVPVLGLSNHLLIFLGIKVDHFANPFGLLSSVQPFQSVFWGLLLVYFLASEQKLFSLSDTSIAESKRGFLDFEVSLGNLDRFIFFPLANISYAVYLLHPPIYLFFSSFAENVADHELDRRLAIFLCSNGVVFLVSSVATHLIDKPAHDMLLRKLSLAGERS